MTANKKNINYRKIRLFYILKILVVGVLIFTSGYLNSYLIELHKTELDKNLKLEEKLSENKEQEMLKLEIKSIDKEQNFRDYLHYLFLTFLCGFIILSFMNTKIDAENKKLDAIEKE